MQRRQIVNRWKDKHMHMGGHTHANDSQRLSSSSFHHHEQHNLNLFVNSLRSENKPTMAPERGPLIYPSVGESKVADEIRSRRKNGELTPLDGVL